MDFHWSQDKEAEALLQEARRKYTAEQQELEKATALLMANSLLILRKNDSLQTLCYNG